MSKDKRALATKVVLQQVLRRCENDSKKATAVPLYVDFVVPPKVLTRQLKGARATQESAATVVGQKHARDEIDGGSERSGPRRRLDAGPPSAGTTSRSAVVASSRPSTSTMLFVLPHATYQLGGAVGAPSSGTALIADDDISQDCVRVNLRHKLFDAVVPIRSMTGSSPEAVKTSLQVTHKFSRYVVDQRIVGRLPASLVHRAARTAPPTTNPAANADLSRRGCTLNIVDLASAKEEGGNQAFVVTLTEAARGERLQIDPRGRCTIRVGHGASTTGEVCENVKHLLHLLKADDPQLFKCIEELRLWSPLTEPIRYMELRLSASK